MQNDGAGVPGRTSFPIEISREIRGGGDRIPDGAAAWLPGIAAGTDAEAATATVPLDRLHPPEVPLRRSTAEEKLWQLAESLESAGMLQPVVVRPHPRIPEHYEVVSGTRRLRAARQVGLTRIPVVCRNFDAGSSLEAALIENIQREDLNPLDTAEGYRRLMAEFGHSQESLARRLGVSRSHVANTLRMLNLPPEVQAMVREDKLSAGHARALLAAPRPKRLAERIITRNLSVRETERLVKGLQPAIPRHAGIDSPTAGLADAPVIHSPAVATADTAEHAATDRTDDDFAARLTRLLGCDVSVTRANGSFDLRIRFPHAPALAAFVRRVAAAFESAPDRAAAPRAAVAPPPREDGAAAETAAQAAPLNAASLGQLARDHGFPYP